MYEFQSTHPHGVRLHREAGRLEGKGVSIHAPARGATQGGMGGHGLLFVSIHAPARGATLTCRLAGVKIMFQSTHPHGVRRSFSA